MPVKWNPIAIPVTKGIDVNSPARLVDPRGLLEAENVTFSRLTGAIKRNGHVSQRVRNQKTLPANIDEPIYSSVDGIPSDWLFGWGPMCQTTNNTEIDTPFATGPHPDAGVLFGSAARDNESLVWSGHQLHSVSSGAAPSFNAVMPHLTAAPSAKSAQAQTQPDAADNGTIRVVTWLDGVDGKYAVVDSVTEATITTGTLPSTDDVLQVRCLPVADWVSMVFAQADDTLHIVSIHQETPLDTTVHSAGSCNGYFDCVKRSESEWILVRNVDGTAAALELTRHQPNGAYSPEATPAFAIPFDVGDDITTIAVAYHVVGQVAVVVRTSGEDILGKCWTLDTGDEVTPSFTLASITDIDRPVAVAALYTDNDGDGLFDAYWDDQVGGVDSVGNVRFDALGTTYQDATRYNLLLASQAFRVGNRTFAWAAKTSDLQSTWLLLDESLLPVGHLDYATANTPSNSSFSFLASVNWLSGDNVKDVFDFHGVLGYRIRVPIDPPASAGVTPIPVYAEPSIKFYSLDFLPALRSAQAGRCTYFPGAQLWAYDGSEVVEAGFHFAPEVTTAEGSGGGLTGDYIYRVDLCHRNAQNEEVRSHSFFTTSRTVANKKINLSIPTVVTRRTNSYFLVYRNEDAGTLWYLVNSRDPSSADFLLNDQSSATVTWVDTGAVSDTDLLFEEQHPGNSGFGYIEPIAAPASTVIASCNDRVWLAGGEIDPGSVMPSRLFQAGEIPSFNPVLVRTVDRSSEPITAMAMLGNILAVFRELAIYLSDAYGPDNVSNGQWTPFEKAHSDVGATSQESLGFYDKGLVFHATSGFRSLMPGGGGIGDIGSPVDFETEDLEVKACVVVAKNHEIRWYHSTGAYVYNYKVEQWTKWTTPAVGAIRNTSTGLTIIATPDGYVWEEQEGVWLDGDRPYRMRVRFAWLRAADLFNFQRIRRIGGLGEWDGETEHFVHVDVYYNERDFPEQSFDWTVPLDGGNTDTFGSATFGAGSWGDTGTTFQDSEWRWRRRVQRQKCSVVSVAIDDNYTQGPGFTLTALGLELGLKDGLDRTPQRGGSQNSTAGNTTLGQG